MTQVKIDKLNSISFSWKSPKHKTGILQRIGHDNFDCRTEGSKIPQIEATKVNDQEMVGCGINIKCIDNSPSLNTQKFVKGRYANDVSCLHGNDGYWKESYLISKSNWEASNLRCAKGSLTIKERRNQSIDSFHTRYTMLNEVEKRQVDAGEFKSFCEGKKVQLGRNPLKKPQTNVEENWVDVLVNAFNIWYYERERNGKDNNDGNFPFSNNLASPFSKQKNKEFVAVFHANKHTRA